MIRSNLKWIIAVWILFQTCSDEAVWDFTQVVKTRTFQVNTPPRWQLMEGAGYDTYVGSISHAGDTIFFDQGHRSFGGLEKVYRVDGTVYIKYLVVDGLPAILHKATVDDKNRKRTIVTLYIDAGDFVNLNRLYFFDPRNPIIERIMIDMMMTHRFT